MSTVSPANGKVSASCSVAPWWPARSAPMMNRDTDSKTTGHCRINCLPEWAFFAHRGDGAGPGSAKPARSERGREPAVDFDVVEMCAGFRGADARGDEGLGGLFAAAVQHRKGRTGVGPDRVVVTAGAVHRLA